MKHVLSTLILLGSGFGSVSLSAETMTARLLPPIQPGLLEYIIEPQLDRFSIQDVETPRGIFQRLEWDGLYGITPKWGFSATSLPETPVHTSVWALPLGATVQHVVAKPSETYKEFPNVRLYPVQALRAEDYYSPATKAMIHFDYNQENWQARGKTEASIRFMSEVPTDHSNLKTISVELADYDPHKKNLKLYQSYLVQVYYTGGQDCLRTYPHDPLRPTETGDPLDRGHVPPIAKVIGNRWEWIQHPCMETRSLKVARPADLLIIHPPALSAAATQLQMHKEMRGIPTEVVSSADIPANGPLTPVDIKNFITLRYKEGFNKLRWVLLFGDVDSLPTYYDGECPPPTSLPTPPTNSGRDLLSRTLGCMNSGGANAVNAGDAYYGQVQGAPYGEIPSIAIGRLPIPLNAQPSPTALAQTIVEKLMNYENGYHYRPEFFQKTLLAAYLEGMPYNGRIIARPGTYAAVMEKQIVTLLDKGGVTHPFRVYRSDPSVNVTHWGSTTPIDNEALQNGKSDNSVAILEAGVFFAMHQGHGNPDGWDMPSLNTRQLTALDTFSQAVGTLTFSINCHAGMFDSETFQAGNAQFGVVPGPATGDYLGETLERNRNGSIAFVGSTRESNSVINKSFGPNLVNSLFLPNNGTLHLGDIINAAKAKTLLPFAPDPGLGYSAQAREYVTIYNQLGDPSLILRRDVIDMSVNQSSVQRNANGTTTIQAILSPDPRLLQERARPRLVVWDPSTNRVLGQAEMDGDYRFKLDIAAEWRYKIVLTITGRDIVTWVQTHAE